MPTHRHQFEFLEAPKKGGQPVKAWIRGVPFDPATEAQFFKVASLPFIFKWVAAMPDAHLGKGTAVGAVIPTQSAIIPAAVGVDIGCGMMAQQMELKASALPDNLTQLRLEIEKAVPHGRTHQGGRSDKGSWKQIPKPVSEVWALLSKDYEGLQDLHPKLGQGNDVNHLGTLGTGNHFIELDIDEKDNLWVLLHSGSRGVGNRIGNYFINLAKEEMREHIKNIPDVDLAYLKEGTKTFDHYWRAVEWAQKYARFNRELMMAKVVQTLEKVIGISNLASREVAVQCHHNYVAKEEHFGELVYVTRKGAVRAGYNELGIVPGSMGTETYIVRGKGNPHSFMSCSHGAGRKHSRSQAKKLFTLEEHQQATLSVNCRKDADVIDETPAAYKDIKAVMAAQEDLIEVAHTLRPVLVVKG